MKTSPFLLAGLTVAAAALLSLPGRAVIFEVEPFNYPGALGSGLNGLAGGTGWGAAWSDTDSLPTVAGTNISLSYPANVPLTPTGGRIELTLDANNNPANRLLGTGMNLATNGQEFYSSALFRRSTVAGELASVLFVGGVNIRWYYGIDPTGAFSVAVDPSNGGQRSTTAFTAAADTTYLLVAKMRTNTGAGGNDEVFLRVFAEGSTVTMPATDAEWDLTANGFSGVTLDTFRLAMTNVSGQTNAFDEFRVGTTFADVTGIPEPSTASLLALGAIALARRRRQ